MIVITGACGQIGGAILRRLLSKQQNVFLVDSVQNNNKSKIDPKFYKYFRDKDEFLLKFEELNKQFAFTAVLHMGAISSTTEKNKDLLVENNYKYSCRLLDLCAANNIPFIFASSASVYGNNKDNSEIEDNECPLNDYAKSKLDFDNYIRKNPHPDYSGQICSLRFFNVSGPNECHKIGQCSPFYTYLRSLLKDGCVNILSGDDGTGLNANQYSRDFIYVEDVVNVILWCLKNKICGIYNVGTGKTNSFLSVAEACRRAYLNRKKDILRNGFLFFDSIEINYQKFPDHLKGKSQPYTKANISKLRAAGYSEDFLDIDNLANEYLSWMLDNKELL